jgi:hypothetical protein
MKKRMLELQITITRLKTRKLTAAHSARNL